MKKSLAVMLALIMVLCMIPTTALAALNTGHKIDVRFTVLYVGDEFNIGYNYGASEKTQFVCQYSTNHSDTAYNNHTIAISDIKAAADRATVNSGYQIVGWSKESNANPTVWPLNKSGTTACNKGTTIYLVAKNPNPQPNQPTDAKIKGLVGSGNIQVKCTTANTTHPIESYSLLDGSYTTGTVTKNGDAYTCTITVDPAIYVAKYNETNGDHTLNPNGQSGSITFEWKNNSWALAAGQNLPIIFTVIHNTQEPPTDKPEKPKPENTPAIPGLTELNEVVKVKCKTAPKSHEEKTFGFNWFSCQVGEVIKNNGEYTCTITVLPDEYVTTYNVMHYPGHTLDPDGQKDTLTLKWNATDKQWENTESAKLPITFTVKCDTVEPTKPDKPGESVILDLINKINVQCIANTDPKHPEKDYDPIAGSYTVGEVEGNPQSGYTCTVTIVPDKYVEKYNADVTGANHTLAAGEGNKTVTLKYDSANDEWKVDIGMPVVFKVQCDNTQPPLDNITIEVSKVWNDDSGTAKKPEKITVLLLANGQEVDRATIPDVNGAWSHSFGAKPANDNGKPINYTVKEENVPDWTPYYYTAGLWKGKLIFQIHNVPTKNTREIKVTKTVSGEGADKAKYFDFKVTLLEYHDNAEVTDQPGYYPLGGTYTFGGVTFTNGVATFKLKDGDSKEITGIPTHIYSNLPLQYKVEEIAPNGYTVKVNGKAGSSINGDFAGDKTVNIAFENVKESGTNPTPTPTPTSTPGGGNGGGGHWHPTTTPVPVIVIPPKTGDMTIWQSILHFLGIR